MNAQSIIEALRGEQVNFVAEDVADLIWLVLHMRLAPSGGRDPGGTGTQATPPLEVKDTPPVEHADLESSRQETTVPAGDGGASAPEDVGAPLYEPSAGEAVTTPGTGVPLRTPAAQSLIGALELSRAMRPLMRRVPSRTRYQFDEEATVELIARTEDRVWMPIMRPAPSRWLDVALVVDSGESMRVWQQMAIEVRYLLERQGAFRDVRTWRLDTDGADGKVRLYGSSSEMERKTRELIDPAGQRLIIVLTDCISPAWKGSHLPQVLREWGNSNPVALAQVLPQSLWARTSLRRAKRVRVHASLPGAPNGLLHKEASSKWLSQRTPEGMPFPVLTLEHLHVRSWARLVVAAGGASSPAFVLPNGEAGAERSEEAGGDEAKPTPEQALSQFEANASPTALELVRLLSAAAPLSLPVMRLVQSVMLPSSRQVHLAEVFNGRLLCRVSPKATTEDPERIQYDFLPGVREKLLKGTPVPDSVQVLKTVSAYLSERFGQSLDFPALLADPNSEQGRALARQNKHFAVVTGKVLSRMGGRYRELAERLVEEAEERRIVEPVKPRIESRSRVSDAATSGAVQTRETVTGLGESTREKTGKVMTGTSARRDALKQTYALVLSGRLGAGGRPYPTNAQLFRDWLDKRGVPPENIHHLVAPSARSLANAFERLANAPDAGLLYFYWSGPASGTKPNDCSLILGDGREPEEHFSLRELLDSRPFKHFSRRLAFIEAYDSDYLPNQARVMTMLPFREAARPQGDEGEFVVFAREPAVAEDRGVGGRFTPALIEVLSELPDEQWPPEMSELTRKLGAGPQPSTQVSWSFKKESWTYTTHVGRGEAEPPASEVRAAAANIPAWLDYLGDDSEYGRGRTILWVDDYPDNNKYEREELEARGFHITESLSTQDALQLLRQRTFDLIISDMGRGRQTRAGLDLLEELRRSGNRTPYVLYASQRALSYRAEVLRKGALDITHAPDRLYALVRQAVTSEGREATPVPPAEDVAVNPAHIFIAYKRNSAEEHLAMELYNYLSGLGHRAFIDQTMVVGTAWATRIEEEIRKADYLVVMLSASSVNSEMLRSEVHLAHRMYQEQRRPALLPVRIDYREPLQYPLSTYLDHLNWFLWEGKHDTPRMFEALASAISGQEPLPMSRPPELPAYPPTVSEPPPDLPPFPSAQPQRLELPEGTMDPQSKFYIERRTDAVALAAIKEQGATIVIKGPRQMGKSTLLMRLLSSARDMSKRIVFMDFQLFERAALEDADVFLRMFCSLLSDELEVPDRTEQFWSSALGSTQKCTRYMGQHILKEVPEPLCLAMDEVDRIFDTDFRSDFFGMLRSWHNRRAFTALWQHLDLVLVTATEPYLLVDNLSQSPFNVGEVITLQDFSAKQVAELNMRYDGLLRAQEVNEVVDLLHGHPYLTRRAFYLIASRNLSVEELLSAAVADDRGPFGDHLRYYLFLMHNRKELAEGMARVLRGQEVPESSVFFRLHGAGLLRRDAGGRIVPRCRLYADFFSQHLL